MKTAYQYSSRRLFACALILTLLLGWSYVFSGSATATAGINEQINFQGRLFTSQGATVPDGFYNIQFKVYSGGDGQTAGNPGGTLLWTENHLNSNGQGVTVRNGFLSVSLGSITPFGSAINWNHDTLWLSMNIAGTGTSCATFSNCDPDGEMLPMKRLTATPYSLNSGLLGGIPSGGFVQLGQGVQTDASANSSIHINKTGSGDFLTLQNNGDDVFRILESGDILFGSGSDRTLSVATAPADTAGSSLTIAAGNAGGGSGALAGGDLILRAGDGGGVGGSGGSLYLDAGGGGGGSVNIGGANAEGISFATDGETRAYLDTANRLYVGNGAAAANPNDFLISGTASSSSGTAGAVLTLQGGDATEGDTNGGNLVLTGGQAAGTGAQGTVLLSATTFSMAFNDPNCYTGGALVANNCTIAASSVNGSAAIVVGFSQEGRTASLPSPTITTAGRIIYITAANGSSDFILSVNGGGVGNEIAMRQNTSATMVWNGNEWTAAGASSSTTLQSAYDNTMQTPGGAELVVRSASNTRGLTIRDSATNPVNGTLFSVQTSSAAGLISVNSNVTEYASNGGAEIPGDNGLSSFPAGTWEAFGNATVTRHAADDGFVASGRASVSTATTTDANDGVKNTFSDSLSANTTYNVSFAARLASGSFTDMDVHYSVDGTTTSATCASSQAVNTSVWTKINCTFSAPASGITADNALLIRQSGSGTARTFYVDNLSVTIAADFNYATDGSVNDGGNFATNWTSVAGADVSRNTNIGHDASDSAEVVTTGQGQGIRNKLSIDPLPGTLYRVTVYSASDSAGFDSFTVRYSRNNGADFIDCADYNTRSVSSSVTSFTKITCYITTDSSAVTDPHVYFTQGDSTARTFYVDTFSMTLSASTTPNVQIGGGITGGPTTLLTLDRGASAPIASDNEALLGSMYYDTALGKIQCYESRGWGACGSAPDNIITISPEYTNAVMHGTGIGTMVSAICSDTLGINDGSSGQPTICGTNETYNFYRWTSPQATAQTYSIYVTYQLPDTFLNFASGQTSIMGRTDSSNAVVQYQIYRNDPANGMMPCGEPVAVSGGSVASWQTGVASGTADPSTCGFTPGNSIVFKIDVTASQNANAYVGNLNFTFNNQ